MLEPICTSLVELADKVSSNQKKSPGEREWRSASQTHPHMRQLLQAHSPVQKKKVIKTDRCQLNS
jgi:hypothetical protein